jgi:hypothetical protein
MTDDACQETVTSPTIDDTDDGNLSPPVCLCQCIFEWSVQLSLLQKQSISKRTRSSLNDALQHRSICQRLIDRADAPNSPGDTSSNCPMCRTHVSCSISLGCAARRASRPTSRSPSARVPVAAVTVRVAVGSIPNTTQPKIPSCALLGGESGPGPGDKRRL